MYKMTLGRWDCIHCGHIIGEVNISTEITKCPKCGVGYEVIERIQPHVCHTVSITRSDQGYLNCVCPIVFAVNSSRADDVKLYFAVVDKVKQKKKVRTVKGLKVVNKWK